MIREANRGAKPAAAKRSSAQELEPLTAVLRATLLKTALALEPRAVMAVMQTTTIRASMTAYSTAVGPSSAFMKFRIASENVRIGPFPLSGNFRIPLGDPPPT